MSLEAQQADCEQVCADNGGSLLGSIATLPAALLVWRTDLLWLRRSRKGDVLVARSASRISRKLGIHLAIEDEVKTKKASIYYVDGGHADDSPEKVLLRRIRDSIAEYELALIRFKNEVSTSETP